jgi:hypothetical protein
MVVDCLQSSGITPSLVTVPGNWLKRANSPTHALSMVVTIKSYVVIR